MTTNGFGLTVMKLNLLFQCTVVLVCVAMVGAAPDGDPDSLLPAKGESPYKPVHYIVESEQGPVAVRTLWRNAPGDPYTKLTVHYADIEGPMPVRLKIACDVAMASVVVAPQRAAVSAKRNEGTVEVQVQGPSDFMFRVNECEPLFLFVRPKDEGRPPGAGDHVIDVSRRGLDASGATNVTAALQGAIDEAAGKGPGTVVLVPAGRYLVGSLWMRSGVTLYLDHGATLVADLDDAAYPPLRYERDAGLHPATDPEVFASIIWFRQVKHARLRGHGTIDGQGQIRRLRGMGPERMRINQIRIVDSEDVLVEGTMLLDSEFWSMHLLRSRNIAVRGVRIINEMPLAGWNPLNPRSVWTNTDGINPDACQNVVVEDVFAHTGDDGFVVKTTNSGPSTPPAAENIVFRRLTVASSTAGLKIGTESVAHSMRNIVWEDVDFLPIHRARCVAFSMRDGARVENVIFRRLRIDCAGRWLDWEGSRRVADQREVSRADFVLFEDVDLPAESAGVIRPPYPVEGIRGLRFKNVRRSGMPVTSREDLQLENSERVEILVIE
jgi:hypothetical protein